MDIVQIMAERSRPIPKYPPGTEHPGGPAIVGEVEPELVIMPDGRSFITGSWLRRMELPIQNMIITEKALDALRANRTRRPIITNAPFSFIDLTGQSSILTGRSPKIPTRDHSKPL